MLTRWNSKNFICNECVPWDILLFKLMHDYHLDEGMVKNNFHLMTIIPPLYNAFHLVNALGEIVRYMKHFYSRKVYEELDMV